MPDTLHYMLAGFLLMFLMLLGYGISLAVRMRVVRKEINRLRKDENSRSEVL